MANLFRYPGYERRMRSNLLIITLFSNPDTNHSVRPFTIGEVCG
jgi:hypothetical protein